MTTPTRTKTYTPPPTFDPAAPPYAPVLGMTVLPPEADIGEASAEPMPTPMSMPMPLRGAEDPRDPAGKVLLGAVATAASGMAVGGLSAGDWSGARIGGALQVGAWGALTLLSSYSDLGPASRAILFGVTFFGLGAGGTWATRRYRRKV